VSVSSRTASITMPGKVRDYRCGGRSYDGHDGTDIRIRNQEIQRQGIEVLAAAPGRVIGTRNDMEDISVKTVSKAAIAGKECGNGVVIDHEGGWRTQYCHMAKGSVRVKVGDQMTTGQPIGRSAFRRYRILSSSLYGPARRKDRGSLCLWRA
jgi:murein DD-endopeptidase MepM/ murein hydrolase activator NlpD